MNLQELSAAINTLGAFCGPRGKNFLAHVEVPAEVQAAFAQLTTRMLEDLELTEGDMMPDDSDEGGSEWGIAMAVAMLTSLLPLLLYLLCQKYILSTFMQSGVKG